MRRGALVLCGGRSRRMGRDKATLAFGEECLLTRVLRRLRPVVAEAVVVARPGQILPLLPEDVGVVFDDVSDQGPLVGLIAGLGATGADAVFATAVDVPFLQSAVVEFLFDRLGDADAAVVEAGGYLQPLVAVYRKSLLPVAARLREEGRMRPMHLFDTARTVRIDEARLREVDPSLSSLQNLNTPEAYEDALERLAQDEPS